jgi:hypothetical protein
VGVRPFSFFYSFFNKGERKPGELGQFCALLGFRKLKNCSNEPFGSVFEVFFSSFRLDFLICFAIFNFFSS